MSSRALWTRTLVVVGSIAMLALGTGFAPSQTGSPEGQPATTHGPDGRAVPDDGTPTDARGVMHYIGHAAGEPTFGFTRDGHIFYTGGDGCVTSCTGSDQMLDTVTPGSRVVLESQDGGETWKDVSPKVGPEWTHVFSLDPMIYVDPVTERIFDSDLNLACSHISYSDDQGQTWMESPIGCGEPVNDHQTLFAGPPPEGGDQPLLGYPHITYYCINHPFFTRCDKSLDGGQTWIPSSNIDPPTCSGLNGHGVVDGDGIVYVPMGENCGTPTLAISTDETDTWTTVRPAGDVSYAGGDPSVDVDEDGNLYFLFVEAGTRHTVLVTSQDHGETWSDPIDVTAPGVDKTNLATIDVGAPGRVAIAYYGTTGQGSPTTWNGYIAAGVDVLTADPVFVSAAVNDPDHPLKVDGCGPGRCGRVLDFIDVNISPDGQAYGSYVDACMETCEATGEEQIEDNQGVLGTLVGGPLLRDPEPSPDEIPV